MFRHALASLEEMVVGLLWPVRMIVPTLGWLGSHIEDWGPARFVKSIEPVVILIAIIAFTIDITDRREERSARAWQLVISKAPGNSGKIEALRYLNSQDPDWLIGWWPWAKKRIPLGQIDLTPPALTEQWKGRKKSERTINWSKCPSTTYLSSVHLPKASLFQALLPCANLVGANFAGANLDRANLTGAVLLFANLTGASSYDTNFSGAFLVEANLSSAVLIGTDFSGAVLQNANLKGANLSEANFTQAQLVGANFVGADFSGVNLTGADLGAKEANRAELKKRREFGSPLKVDAKVTQAKLESARPSPPPRSLPDGLTWPFVEEDGKWVRRKK